MGRRKKNPLNPEQKKNFNKPAAIGIYQREQCCLRKHQPHFGEMQGKRKNDELVEDREKKKQGPEERTKREGRSLITVHQKRAEAKCACQSPREQDWVWGDRTEKKKRGVEIRNYDNRVAGA